MRLLSLPGLNLGGNSPYSPVSKIAPNPFQSTQMNDTFSRAAHTPAPTQAMDLYFSGKCRITITNELLFKDIILYCRGKGVEQTDLEVAEALNQDTEVKRLLNGKKLDDRTIGDIRKRYIKTGIFTSDAWEKYKLERLNPSESEMSSSQVTGIASRVGTSDGQSSSSHPSRLTRQMGGMPPPPWSAPEAVIRAWLITALFDQKLSFKTIQTRYPHFHDQYLQSVVDNENEARELQAAYLKAKEIRENLKLPSPDHYNQTCEVLNHLPPGNYTQQALIRSINEVAQDKDLDISESEIPALLNRIATGHEATLQQKHPEFYAFLQGKEPSAKKPKDFQFKKIAPTPSLELELEPDPLHGLSVQGAELAQELSDPAYGQNFQPTERFQTLRDYIHEQHFLPLTERDKQILQAFAQQYPDEILSQRLAEANAAKMNRA
jgi:hypothetical protein